MDLSKSVKNPSKCKDCKNACVVKWPGCSLNGTKTRYETYCKVDKTVDGITADASIKSGKCKREVQ